MDTEMLTKIEGMSFRGVEHLPNKHKSQSSNSNNIKKIKEILNKREWTWCCTPIMPAVWEAEIERVIVGGQPGQKAKEGPSSQTTCQM
jgi:hypothetical protein